MKVWLAIQNEDHSCYNIMARNKKSLIAELEPHVNETDYKGELRFQEVYQLDVDASDVFALLDDVLNECGGKNKYMGNVVCEYTARVKNGKVILSKC